MLRAIKASLTAGADSPRHQRSRALRHRGHLRAARFRREPVSERDGAPVGHARSDGDCYPNRTAPTIVGNWVQSDPRHAATPAAQTFPRCENAGDAGMSMREAGGAPHQPRLRVCHRVWTRWASSREFDGLARWATRGVRFDRCPGSLGRHDVTGGRAARGHAQQEDMLSRRSRAY